MRPQQHKQNLIWLLLLVWLPVALASDMFAYTVTTELLNEPRQASLRVYTDNDDVALEETRELSEREAVETPLRLSSILQLRRSEDALLAAVAILACFVPVHFYRYRRRRTRTPSLVVHIV